MSEIVTQPSIDPDYRYESRARTNSSGTAPSTPSSSSDYVTGEADDSSESKAIVPFTLKSVDALLSISKAASPDDLQEMVEKCKRMVLESAECSEERKWLVRRLIELRLRAQELRETSGDNLMETQVMLGHHLVPQKYYIATSGPTYCDHCSGAIWTMLQSWYMCRDCSFCSHWKCINDIRRVCAHVVASETGGYTYTKDICPEKGLSAQGYRCAECHTKITFKSAWVEPRLCDYSGLFYCQRCHWNSMAVIPARVVRNWDMEPRKVCRSASQLLTLLEDRPVLSLEHLNPKLFTLIPDLTLIKMLKLLNRIRVDWQVWAQDRDVNVLHKYAEQGRKMTIMYTVTIYSTGSLFMIQPIIPAIIDVYLKNGSRPREFPLPVDYYHLDAQKYYFYIMMYSYPCVSLGLLVTMANDALFIVYVQHCCGTFTALGQKLERIANNEKSAEIGKTRYVLKKKDMIFERLVSCVERHNDAIEFAELIEATYSWCLFFIVGFHVVGFSILGLQIVKRSNNHQGLIRHIAWLLAGVMNLYLYNYMSQVLMDHTISVRYCIYNGKWYRLSPKVLQILHFMMMRCNVSCNLTAGKISTMSVKTFGVRLREELQMMKRYLVFCPDADFQGLPWRTGLRTHLIENSSNYSMKDLVDLQSGVLMEEIRSAYDAMRNHITDVCELCRARGHLCELCGNDEVIYPWDTSAISCQQCAAVHHRVCWAKRNNCCPRCTRIQQRLALKSQETIDDVADTLTNDRH